MVRTVLVVDDHAGFRELARALLEDGGYAVVAEAGDGASALAAARAVRPDAVLLDVHLPDMDGFTVAAALAREHPAPRVVLTSTDADEASARWCGARARCASWPRRPSRMPRSGRSGGPGVRSTVPDGRLGRCG